MTTEDAVIIPPGYAWARGVVDRETAWGNGCMQYIESIYDKENGRMRSLLPVDSCGVPLMGEEDSAYLIHATYYQVEVDYGDRFGGGRDGGEREDGKQLECQPVETTALVPPYTVFVNHTVAKRNEFEVAVLCVDERMSVPDMLAQDLLKELEVCLEYVLGGCGMAAVEALAKDSVKRCKASEQSL